MTNTFDDTRLPEEVEQGAKGGPAFMTSVVSLSSGDEQRVANWQQPMAKWDIGYGIQSPAELILVEQFFYARRGKLRGFRFKDWHDFQCTNELIGIGNGTNLIFVFGKTYGAADPAPFFRRITRLVTGSVNIYVNAVLQSPANYDLFTSGGWVRFHAGHAPANLAVVSYDCQFDIPVRFDIDEFALTLFWENAAQVPSIPVIEIRDTVNLSPTVSLINTTSTIQDSQDMSSNLKVADVVVADDPFSQNVLSLSGVDAASFVLVGTLSSDGTGVSLDLAAGTALDGAGKPTYAVTVGVSDPSLSGSVIATVNYTLTVSTAPRPPTVALSNEVLAFPWNLNTTSHVKVADITVSQPFPNVANNILSLTGTNAATFELVGTVNAFGTYSSALYLIAGTADAPDSMSAVSYAVTVNVSNADFANPPQSSASVIVTLGVVPGVHQSDTAGAQSFVIPNYGTLVVEGWAAGAGAPGINAAGTSGGDTSIDGPFLCAATGGVSPALVASDGTFGTAPGQGGVARGGDININGNPGGNGMYSILFANILTAASGAGGADGGPNGGTGGAAISVTAVGDFSTYYQVTQPAPTNGNGGNANGVGDGGAGAAQVQWVPDIYQGNNAVANLLPLALALWGPVAHGRPGAGSGAYFKKTMLAGAPGSPAIGATINFTVGAAGAGGSDVAAGGAGGHGRVKISWS